MLRRGRKLADATDERLIELCLAGQGDGWEELVERYKNLVYSVPVRFHLSPEDAADVFQSVWTELYQELPRLRRAGAVRSWLMTVALHQSYRTKQRRSPATSLSETTIEAADPAKTAAVALADLEREQSLRDGLRRLPPRCQQLLEMLFFHDPPLPYAEAARRLKLAEGSIGFIRGRCLKKLKAILEEGGFQ